MFLLSGLIKQASQFAEKHREPMKLELDSLLWGYQVSSSTESSSTTTSTGKNSSSPTLASVDQWTTQLQVRRRYLRVGPVSWRSWRNVRWTQCWLSVTRPHSRCWELKTASRNFESDRHARVLSVTFKSFQHSTPPLAFVPRETASSPQSSTTSAN